MHLDAERMERFLSGELGPEERDGVEAHLQGCGDCRRYRVAVEEERRLAGDLLARLDGPVPEVSVEAVMDAADVQVVRPARAPRRMRIAAGIVLVLVGAGTAYALPGSPVPGWIDRLLGDGGDVPSLSDEGAGTAGAAGDPSGIAVLPGARIEVRITTPRAGRTLTVRMVPGPQLRVTASDGTAAYRSEPARLVVDNSEAGSDLTILVPTSSPEVEVFVGERSVFHRLDGEIAAQVGVGPDGSYSIPLGGG